MDLQSRAPRRGFPTFCARTILQGQVPPEIADVCRNGVLCPAVTSAVGDGSCAELEEQSHAQQTDFCHDWDKGKKKAIVEQSQKKKRQKKKSK